MKNLSALTVLLLRMLHEIGGRVPVTPAMDRAEQWGVAALAGGKRGRTR